MPSFRITIVNEHFESTSEEELTDFDSAKSSAIKGALELGAEQILGGKPLFGAEIIIGQGVIRQRFILSIATSALK